MPNVLWDPDGEKPEHAARLEAEMQRIAPGAQVKLTFRDGEWLVRALAPSAMCSRGGEFTSRDVSAGIAELLNDNDCRARVFPRR